MRATLALGAVALTLAPSALADAVYHSAHIALTPVGASPLRSGFVENVHPNGPNVFAHEQYVLNGAVPNMTYKVTIHITSLADTTCATPFLNLDTASLTTNAAGTARRRKSSRPQTSAASPTRPSTLTGRSAVVAPSPT